MKPVISMAITIAVLASPAQAVFAQQPTANSASEISPEKIQKASSILDQMHSLDTRSPEQKIIDSFRSRYKAADDGLSALKAGTLPPPAFYVPSRFNDNPTDLITRYDADSKTIAIANVFAKSLPLSLQLLDSYEKTRQPVLLAAAEQELSVYKTLGEALIESFQSQSIKSPSTVAELWDPKAKSDLYQQLLEILQKTNRSTDAKTIMLGLAKVRNNLDQGTWIAPAELTTYSNRDAPLTPCGPALTLASLLLELKAKNETLPWLDSCVSKQLSICQSLLDAWRSANNKDSQVRPALDLLQDTP